MVGRLAERIKWIIGAQPESSVAQAFAMRLSVDESLTRDENPYTHFCVYFAAYDPTAKEVFIGHHKKSDLWLFSGGHIDQGETPEEALTREIGEEWGLKMALEEVKEPRLLTVTEIDNPSKQACTRHYDIWYFVPVDKVRFNPDPDLLATEFHTNVWMDTTRARVLVTDPGTLEAIGKFEDIFSR